MIKVITYGTYDLLHYGHIRLLERAKELGDYLIVGVTSDAFDRTRGKINVQQSLVERLEAVKKTGLADKIIVEEYEGQKIDDIKKYDVDIFTVGSDWIGKFDYLKEYCKVIYLDRTQGVSSSELRAVNNNIKIGVVGDTPLVEKYIEQSKYVNGVQIEGICSNNINSFSDQAKAFPHNTSSLQELIQYVDAMIVVSHPEDHFTQIKEILNSGKHVLCESPIVLKRDECKELFDLADKNHLVLFDSIKTAYSTAYERLILLAKSGRIGDVVSVDVTCTSLQESQNLTCLEYKPRGSIMAWGPTALLPVFQLLGENNITMDITSRVEESGFDDFTKVNMTFDQSVASVLVGKKIKSEGELIVAGTNGYFYVPAPWWKTDYFEIRYENASDNRRYFYQLDGEGIRNEISSFSHSIKTGVSQSKIAETTSEAISDIIEHVLDKKSINLI